MNTNELTKELDALARALRSLSHEASATVATALELERRRHATAKPANKFEPRALTIADITGAIAAATRKPALSVELRKDVFERRCEKNSVTFANQFVAAVKAGKAAPAGAPFAPRFTKLPEGVRSLYDATPKWGKTAINADAHAWTLAARYALVQLIPNYSEHALDRYAERARAGAGFEPIYRLREQLVSTRDRWLDDNTLVYCDADPGGQVTRIHGLNPAPFAELLKTVAAGNPDPLGILTT